MGDNIVSQAKDVLIFSIHNRDYCRRRWCHCTASAILPQGWGALISWDVDPCWQGSLPEGLTLTLSFGIRPRIMSMASFRIMLLSYQKEMRSSASDCRRTAEYAEGAIG